MSPLYLYSDYVLFYQASILPHYINTEQTTCTEHHCLLHFCKSEVGHWKGDKEEERKTEEIRGKKVSWCWPTNLRSQIILKNEGCSFLFCLEKASKCECKCLKVCYVHLMTTVWCNTCLEKKGEVGVCTTQ